MPLLPPDAPPFAAVVLLWAFWLLLRFHHVDARLWSFALQPPRWYLDNKRLVLQAWSAERPFPLLSFVHRHWRRTTTLGLSVLGYLALLRTPSLDPHTPMLTWGFAGLVLLHEIQLQRWMLNFLRYAERCHVTALKRQVTQSERREL